MQNTFKAHTEHPAAERRQPQHRRGRASYWTAVLLLSSFPGSVLAQSARSGSASSFSSTSSTTSASNPDPASNSAPPTEPIQAARPPQAAHRSRHEQRAAKAFLGASKLFKEGRFEAAMRGYERAAALDPGDADYPLAVIVARNHLVTALIQAAAKERIRGDKAAAGTTLAHALELDPKNAQLNEHLNALGNDALRGQTQPLYEEGAETLAAPEELLTATGGRSFHLHTNERQIIEQVFKAYGIDATVDSSIPDAMIRLDVDEVDFATAARILGMTTDSFYVPLDEHRVLVARNTPANREEYEREDYETVYVAGLNSEEFTNVINLAKNIFHIEKAWADPSAGTVSLRAPEQTLTAFNATLSAMLDGQNQVLLEVRLIQLAHTSQRDTGVQAPQTVSAFNVYSEEQSILNANQSLVQQIISSGLAAPGDTLTILGILLASGQVSNSLFSNGIALFGGGLTESALAPGAATLNLNLNSSDSRELDQIQLRLGNGEAATIRSGSRYPIQTASYSSPLASAASIPGLTSAGTSGALGSLLSSLTSQPSIPMIDYQDLGLTLKATPEVMRGGDVALTLDLKLTALSGSSINGNPILDSRAYSGVVTLKEGTAAVVASEMDRNESLAVSGTPGLSEIPGLNDLTGKNNQKNYATLLMVITAHVIRGTQAAGHSPMMRVEREQRTQ